MALSIQYELRELLGAIRYDNNPTTFLASLLMRGQTPKTHTKNYVVIDVIRGGRRIAAYVSRRGDPERVGKKGFDSKLHALPYTYQEMTFTYDDLETRLPGMTVYESNSPQAMLDTIMGENLRELDNRIVVREEQQIAEALTSGKQVIQGDGVDYEVDYGRNAGSEVTLTAGDRWSESATRDIRGDFKAAAAQMTTPGVDGGDPNIVIMGKNAGANYIADQAVQGGLLDLRRVTMGEIAVEFDASMKVTYIGRHVDIGISVDVYVYSGTYVNSSGVDTPYIATDDAIFLRRGLIATPHYSSISNFHSGIFVGRRFPRQYITQEGKKMILTLESGPLMAVHEIDATYCLHTNG